MNLDDVIAMKSISHRRPHSQKYYLKYSDLYTCNIYIIICECGYAVTFPKETKKRKYEVTG